jgi:hypothetical protein
LRHRFLILTAALASAASEPVLARDDQPYRPSPPTITASPLALAVAGFDRDLDLQVSRPEYDWGVSKSFAAFDRDSDEALSLIELTAWAEATLGSQGALPGRFDFDRDGNDRIARSEFIALFGSRFADLDKNKDMVLSRSELVSVVDPPFQMRGRRRTRIDPAQPR